MKNLIKNVVLTLTLTQTVPAFANDEGYTLGIGESKTVKLSKAAESINLSSQGVVTVSKGSNKTEVRFYGKGHGQADVSVKLADGEVANFHISVVDNALLGTRLERIKKIVGSTAGLSVSQRGSQVVISGKVTSRSTERTLASLKAQFPGLVVDGTEHSLAQPNTVVQTVNRILSDNDIGNIQAVSYGRIMVLEGSPKDEYERELAHRIAKTISPDIEDRMSKKSSGASSINIEVMFVEVEKKDQKEIGFSTIPGKNTLGKVSMPGLSGLQGKLGWQVGSLDNFLNMLQTKSASRVLSNPQLIGRSGEEAKFHSGGTSIFGVETTDENGKSKLTFKEIDYGIELNVKPIIDRLGQIDVKLQTKVSELSPTLVKNQIAEVLLTDLKTAVTLKSGQSILLSGLVNKRNRKTVDKVPVLGDIPILGELFKSRKQNTEEKELLILVTMNKISANDQQGEQAIKTWNSARKDVEFSIFD